MFNIWRVHVREYVNNGIYIVYDTAELDLNVWTTFPSIEQIEFVFKEMFLSAEGQEAIFPQSQVSLQLQ